MTTATKRYTWHIISLALLALALFAMSLPYLAPSTRAATYVRIKNKWQGTYLYENAGVVKYGTPAASDLTSQWEVLDFNGAKRIRNRASGSYMHIENQTGSVQAGVVNDAWMSARWTVEAAPTAGYSIIRSAWQTGLIIHIENLTGNAQYGSLPTTHDSPQWLLETVTGGATATPTRSSTTGATATRTSTTPAGTSIKVNFQLASAPTVAGYLVDGGAVYGDRGNGHTYGWNVDNTTWARDRNAANAPDQRYDTLTHMQKGGGSVWELALPNGSYSVRIVAGDPSNTDSVYHITAEGQTVVSGTPSPSASWFDGTRNVTVSDGRLTIANGAGASNNKICFLEIASGGGVTSTPTRTNTGVATATRTNTGVATATRTNTGVATATRTNTTGPTPTTGPGSNLAQGKPVTACGNIHTFVAANATDNNLTTYWEGSGQPCWITVDLGANANVSSIVVKLNPDPIWGPRTQTFQVLGRGQSSTTFGNLVASATYSFSPSTNGNSVSIPISTVASAIQLSFTGNSGAPAGQVAELQVIGTWAPNPDLTVGSVSWTPSAPTEANAITLNANVVNSGTAASGATTINFLVDGTVVGSAPVAALAAGASATVSLSIGQRAQGSYTVGAVVDPANTVVEQDNNNNSFTASSPLSVVQAPGPDLQIVGVSMSPQSPLAGNAVSFVVAVQNRGTTGVAAGTTTRVVIGTTTLTNAGTPAIAAGATVNVTVGTWTAVNGSTPLVATADATNIVAETIENNNAFSQTMAVGRGAVMPYARVEAESAAVATNGTRLAPNYKLADFAGEASGRSAVLLDAPGEYVELTLPIAANALVVRHAIPNSADGAGLDAPLSVYAGGVDKGNITLSSRYSYVYASPTTLGNLGYSNTPGGTAYWLYEEANMLLDQVYPAGTRLRLQKDSGDVAWVYVDFVEVENVAPPAANPDPARYVQVSATKNIDAALNEFRQDATKLGIFIPAGTWELSSKIFVYGRATQIVGAGPWHTRIVAPQTMANTDMGFNIAATANGSVIRDLSAWGNYRYRQDGPGKFIDGNGMQNVTVQNVWAEHFVCLYWGVAASNNTFRDLRIRNMFADGINMTNGSNNNLITNSEARGTGDDAFALFSAVDAGGSYNTGNKYTNLSAILTRRAAAFAVYGGSGNLYQNLYGADTLTYPGITISSLSFGYNTLGFGDVDNVFDGVTLERVGGDFWTSVGGDDTINDYQNFAAIWFFAGDRPFQNILVKNVDINNPVYFGVMFQTKYPEQPPMKNVRLENININGAPRYGIKLVIRAEGATDTPPVGSASFTNVKVNNAGLAAIYGESRAPGFTVNRVSGNNW